MKYVVGRLHLELDACNCQKWKRRNSTFQIRSYFTTKNDLVFDHIVLKLCALHGNVRFESSHLMATEFLATHTHKQLSTQHTASHHCRMCNYINNNKHGINLNYTKEFHLKELKVDQLVQNEHKIKAKELFALNRETSNCLPLFSSFIG